MVGHTKRCIDYNDNLFPTRIDIPCICDNFNQIYEILVWKHGEDQDGLLGDTDYEIGFDTETEARMKYEIIEDYKVKMLMRYEGLDPADSGDVLEEDWKE